MPVVTLFLPVGRLDIDEDVVGNPDLALSAAVAHTFKVDPAQVHEVALGETRISGEARLLFVQTPAGWRMMRSTTDGEHRWLGLDLQSRMNELVRLANNADHAPDLLGLAAQWCRYLDEVEQPPAASPHRADVASGVLRFWWEREAAAGLDQSAARMLLGFSTDSALRRRGPVLLGW